MGEFINPYVSNKMPYDLNPELQADFEEQAEFDEKVNRIRSAFNTLSLIASHSPSPLDVGVSKIRIDMVLDQYNELMDSQK